ncbi:hypothetical protein HWV62_12520 [Athelia sp. TMB]|nr:hypothetical protein HWV62_12520 [Athelia sp. TMB]
MDSCTTEAYNVNFCFPVRDLCNSRVKLTPFEPAKHASPYFDASAPHPELYKYLPFGPFSTLADYVDTFVESRVHSNPSNVLFAIIDTTGAEDAVAGTIGLQAASPANLSAEIGFVIVLPAFQRTHVARTAIGLLLRYALDAPSGDGGGLGLRRVQWQAHSENKASVRAAERLGFRVEALIRWDRVLRDDKLGKVGRGGQIGRDTWMLGICWDDWEGGVRAAVNAILEG